MPVDLPAGWTLYQGTSGLVAQYPPGWQVEEREGGAFLVHRSSQGPAAAALVYVRPTKFKGRNAAQTARSLPQLDPGMFSGVEVTQVERLKSRADAALAHIRFTSEGQRFTGSVLVFNRGGSGMLFGISATEANWAADAPVMTQILARFWYAPKAQRTGGAAMPEMVTWRDPNEGAFTLPVPEGWRIQGGLKRPSVLAWRSEVLATSPDASIQLRLGDGELEGMFVVPPAMLPGVNLEGMRASAYGGMYLSYLPGYRFLTQFYLPRRFASISNVQVQDLPEVALEAQRRDPIPLPAQSRADAGAASFDVELPAGRYRGYSAVITRLAALPPQLSGITTWWVENGLIGYVCRPELEATANAILSAMGQGFRWDPRWRALQAQADAQSGEAIRRNVSEMNDLTWRNLQQRSAAMDRAYQPTEQWSRGETLIRDPQTHEEYRVPSGYREYYRIGSSERFLGIDTPNSPDLPEYWFPRMEMIAQ